MARITETVKILLVANILFFLGTQFVGDYAYQLFAMWFPENENFRIWQIFTHMFMHGGFTHILFNMFALFMFGSMLEQTLGKNKFIFLYFSAGFGAVLLHTLVNYFNFQSGYNALADAGMSSTQIQNLLDKAFRSLMSSGNYNVNIPDTVDGSTVKSMIGAYSSSAVGASGAIYGILVAFGMLFPNVKLFLMFVPIPIKAKYFIPGLILLDLFSGITGYSLMGAGIAHFAHIGGALFGFITMWYWKRNQFNNNRWN
ncbi:rhomboid family intramembrane serine protease [Mesonia maritima]|uniref:Membrane associated rhomboid family serine protease n=1 Tax=Mesonia maritima TaxID=1793873 RepID=A0ABU1K3U2_9FLAO|nr:rhomboid family intramembrane serine protease [Mesonia maritima]MDR6300285.1 membrane associated rhomboid family serine protease [Mesonia maritima]